MRMRLGETRTSIQDRHAFVSADSVERTTLPNWVDTELIFAITPAMGAHFSQYIAEMRGGSVGKPPLSGIERFVFVVEGKVRLTLDDGERELAEEGFAFLPAGTPHQITSSGTTRVIVFERAFIPAEGMEPPYVLTANINDVDEVQFRDDPGIRLKKLMPGDARFDLEVNTMDFSPGASLHHVETHYMEHGLLMLNGGGIYRLDNNWYPIDAGDAIWMGPYCPQWFGAIGRSNARYLLYKDFNRDPLAKGLDPRR